MNSDSASEVRVDELPSCGSTDCSKFKRDVMFLAIEQKLLSAEVPLAAFIDINGVGDTLQSLCDAFPAHFRHAFAAKANPMSKALALVREYGLDCEVASPGELEQAIRVGFEPASIVYDEPAKTKNILLKVLTLGINLNIDNFQELDVVASILEATKSRSTVGFRINPQVGAGTIGATSTATSTSKFGVALRDSGNRTRIIDCYRNNAWMTSLHTHIGSQGCELQMISQGIASVVELAQEINSTVGRQQVKTIDIGGGLPVNFESEEMRPTFANYANILRRTVPDLFTGEFVVKTEFGRSIFAKNGFIASRIAYTKSSGGRQIAISHAGAQVAVRTVFVPDLWPLRVSAFTADGRLKDGNHVAQDIGGPCCFAGDVIAHEREMPLLEAGDYVVLHDTGAYYFSSPYYYNCLVAPAVHGVQYDDIDKPVFETWRAQQSMDDMLRMLG